MPPRSIAQPGPTSVGAEYAHALERGRACYERGDWDDAFVALTVADQCGKLAPQDLERLAWSAGLTARDEQMLATQERLFHAWLAEDKPVAAARAAFWLGFRLLALGEAGRSSGWLSRTRRLVELHGQECVEQGYLLLPDSQRLLSAGKFAEANECAARAARIGERFSERDLVSFARSLQARALFGEGDIERGLALMDEVMVAVSGGELSPVVTGIVYCTAIASCQRFFALDRVRDWTSAMTRWCEARPQLGMFTGNCLVHRAEALELNGAWSEALAEAARAAERCVRSIERIVAGNARYRQAEIHRLRGDFTSAAAAYHEASRAGYEPQPGIALLRLMQGDARGAANVSRRAVAATSERLARIRLLPAHVEIMLAVGDLDAARTASAELLQTAQAVKTEVLAAIAAHASAAVHLAEGRPGLVLGPARRAFVTWLNHGAPYLAARLRVLMSRACIALCDRESARIELQCAGEVFEKLGALPDLVVVRELIAKLDLETQAAADPSGHGLSERELQVLKLVATGKTNKAIARELSLSERTIDRHLGNIFTKIDVSSRAAATAFAYKNTLL